MNPLYYCKICNDTTEHEYIGTEDYGEFGGRLDFYNCKTCHDTITKKSGLLIKILEKE